MTRISDDLMYSEVTDASCVRNEDGWQASWIGGRVLDRNGAVTALAIVDFVALGVEPGHRLWPHVCGWLAEIGLTVADLPASEPGATRRWSI